LTPSFQKPTIECVHNEISKTIVQLRSIVDTNPLKQGGGLESNEPSHELNAPHYVELEDYHDEGSSSQATKWKCEHVKICPNIEAIKFIRRTKFHSRSKK
jgi:hypothetical protein